MDSTNVDLIAEEFADALRRGENPSIDQFVDRYPQAPANLRDLLLSIALIEGLKSDGPGDEAEAATIDQLDDYKVVREIGRGGMGVVLEAIDESLGRRVAIKILSNHRLGDPKQLARFRREARAAAKLRHPNIVPVFGVGQSNDHHYYVMDYIDGVSLKQDLEQRRESLAAGDSTAPVNEQCTDASTDVRWVANLGAHICDALDYAHHQGVLHRDIKPANLLIDRHGNAWVTDFGLAKLAEQALTATGDIMGTPQYMPPESFEGTYDVRSEIYAMGLTLHEMLTLRPAIDGSSPADVMRNALTGRVRSPKLHRRDIPKDLETIILKCLAQDADARYQTIDQVRDDLNRFLASRPITARRTSLIRRAVRWTRRDPQVALLTFASFGLLIALAGVSAGGYWRTRQALDAASAARNSAEQSLIEKTEALDSAELERRRAENNLQVALTAFDAVMQNISNRSIEAEEEFFGEFTDTTSPYVSPDDAKLLQSLLGFFDELGANNSANLLAESALAARRAGEIYQRLGQLRNADRAYVEALNRYRKLSKQHPGKADFVGAQSHIQNDLAMIAALRGQFSRANQLFDQTTKLLNQIDMAHQSPEMRFQFARAHRLFASVRTRSGMDDIAGRGKEFRQQFARRPAVHLVKARIEAELDAANVAIQTLELLTSEHPDVVRFRVELARAYRDFARVAATARQIQESRQAMEQSIEQLEALLVDNQPSPAIRYELAATLAATETFGFDSLMRTVRAAELSQQLLAESPNQPRYRALRAHALVALAKSQLRQRRPKQAADGLDEAIALYDTLAENSPEVGLYTARRWQALETKADSQYQRGDSDAAIKTLQTAIELSTSHTHPRPESPVVRRQLQRMEHKLARWRSR